MDVDTETTEKADSFVIKATNVPQEFFQNRDVAKRYFRRFGKVKLVMFKPKKNALLVEYTNEDSMLNALEVGGEHKGQFFNVTRDTESIIKKKKTKKDPDPDWTDDPEVKAELEAMGGYGHPKSYDLRSEAMSVDPVEVNQKNKQRKWRGVTGSPKPQKKKGLGGKEILSAEQADLAQIVKQQALNVEDKFRILDARDKLIRIKMKKNIELSKARATVGTCPDMCPEKERLMREVQHQVALYEQEAGKEMNPRLAVKQYSRSSADQEAPLPQELRPVSVLQMTMGYLMHRIMGLCDTSDVNISEWYHFLWDRTRGIRKDITQQELCCQGSVELVEQCARFHIFCSARLVSEDPSVFDQKINTENLTKCLQTLKYMYHDLQLKGESCRNEPEFRAYIILLNLNDGNFMWEVQQLQKDIQQSKEVKFALEVYSSLDKHNYVKFFKLVNSTTFLNACILMRYFIQVRISAINTFLKSYSPRVSQTSLPVHYLTKILGFEGPESAIDFFESYGLYTNVERTRIIFNKPGFSAPEYPYILDRAINLVESKRKLSVGEVVCGKQLPPKLYETHIPQDSFDKDGYLKITPDLDEIDSVRKEEVKVTEKNEKVEIQEPPRLFSSPVIFQTQAQPSQSIFVPPKQNTFSTNIFGQGASEKSIFAKSENENEISNIFAKSENETVFTTNSLWSQPPANTFSAATTTRNIFGGEIAPEVTITKITKPEVTKTEVKEDEIEQKRIAEEAKRREEERLRKQKEEEEKRLEEMRQNLLREQEERRRLEHERKVELMKKKLIEEQKRKEQERRKNVEIKAAVSNVISEMLDTVEENIKKMKLKEISRKIHCRKIKQVVTKWRENTRRKRKRKALDFNPVWFGPMSTQDQIEELKMTGQNLALQSMKRYKRGKPFEIQLNEKDNISKVDLSELTYKLLRKKFLELDMKLHNELFWKVTISLPNELEFGCGLNHIEKILDNYVKWEKRGATTVMVDQSKSTPTITYCLEKQKGVLINSRNETNGFIFISNEFNDDLYKRILTNFKNYGVFVKIPVVLVLQTYAEHKSNLKALLEEGNISDYLILVDKFTSKNLINLIEEALIFLSTRAEKSPPLEMDTLKSFLAKYLCNDVWKRANSFAKWNSNYKDCLKNPNTVIYLYNEALDRLKKILLDKSCREHPKFPEIFKEFLRTNIPDSLPCDYKYFPNFWDNASYTKHIEAVLNSLHLPNFLEDWPPSSQVQLEISISKYCTQILREPQKCFYKTFSILLRNIDLSVNFKDVRNVIWTDVIELLTLEKLNQTNFSLYGTGFVNQSIYNQLVVVYDVNMLNEYVRSDWFYINHPIIRQKILQLLQEAKEERVNTAPVHDDDLDLDKILAKIRQPQNLNVDQIKTEMTTCRKLLTDLEETVGIHKQILQTSGQLLKTILEEN